MVAVSEVRQLNAVDRLCRYAMFVLLRRNAPKIFVVGLNKTGTTTLKRTFEQHGFQVGNQRRAERLLRKFISGDEQALVNYCRSAQVFQDIPFSLSPAYEILDRAFPDAKFVLSVRDSAEQWYETTVNFIGRKYNQTAKPTDFVYESPERLKEHPYVWKGWAYELFRYQYPEHPDRHPTKMERIARYHNHNRKVQDHFRDRPEKLLVLNVAQDGDYQRLCNFVGIRPRWSRFPHKNKGIR